MTKMKRLLKKLAARIPTRLPQGMTEFDAWAEDIIDTYQVPYNDSFIFSLAVMVMHLKPTQAYMPKHYFGLSLYKAMSNEVVSQVMQDLKEKQKAAIAAAAEASKTAEVTAQSTTGDVSAKQ